VADRQDRPDHLDDNEYKFAMQKGWLRPCARPGSRRPTCATSPSAERQVAGRLEFGHQRRRPGLP
jgi:hypothetical protein